MARSLGRRARALNAAGERRNGTAARRFIAVDRRGDDEMARTAWMGALMLGFVLALTMTRRRPR